MTMKIYTKTGDAGHTGLFGGPRVPKDDLRIEAYGTVDELNSVVGVCRTHSAGTELEGHLTQIQHDLFALGAELASPDPDRNGTRWGVQTPIERLEKTIDVLEAGLAPLSQFILPAGAPAATHLHLARTVCRRAERRLVSLANLPRDPMQAAAAMGVSVTSEESSPDEQRTVVIASFGGEGVAPGLIVYLNRLGDLLFVMARAANAQARVADEPWRKPSG